MHEEVQNYYGQELKTSTDLKTDACCTLDSIPGYLKPIMAKIHPDVSSKYYGCGLVAPEKLEGMKILDLGSGSGQDCFVLSALVGEKGEVVGVDMTDEQLAVANEFVDYHRKAFGYAVPNVSFKKGYIEKLDELGFDDNYFDIIISNCVINLSPDKESVLKEVHRLLKPGGEMYFSDVYSDRRIPEELQKDSVLYGECLSGALYWNDFLNLAQTTGFKDPRLVSSRELTVENKKIEEQLGNISFYSAVYRLFKIEGLEQACEDYGQAVVYRGGIKHCEEIFELDSHHTIERGKVFPVCGNTWRMLAETRFKEHFDFIGDFKTHYGIFEGCGTEIPFQKGEEMNGGCC